MKKILVASNNKHKIEEIETILSSLSFQIISMQEAGVFIDIEETGRTFNENAIIKVEALKPYWEGAILADDSGIEFDCLNGLPGVYSARFLGEDTAYELKNELVLQMMEKQTNRKARYVCCIAFWHNNEMHTFESYLNGEIAKEAKGNYGFGYDPVFYLPEYDCNLAELLPEKKNAISHRRQSLEKLLDFLSEESNEK